MPRKKLALTQAEWNKIRQKYSIGFLELDQINKGIMDSHFRPFVGKGLAQKLSQRLQDEDDSFSGLTPQNYQEAIQDMRQILRNKEIIQLSALAESTKDATMIKKAESASRRLEKQAQKLYDERAMEFDYPDEDGNLQHFKFDTIGGTVDVTFEGRGGTVTKNYTIKSREGLVILSTMVGPYNERRKREIKSNTDLLLED